MRKLHFTKRHAGWFIWLTFLGVAGGLYLRYTLLFNYWLSALIPAIAISGGAVGLVVLLLRGIDWIEGEE